MFSSGDFSHYSTVVQQATRKSAVLEFVLCVIHKAHFALLNFFCKSKNSHHLNPGMSHICKTAAGWGTMFATRIAHIIPITTHQPWLHAQ